MNSFIIVLSLGKLRSWSVFLPHKREATNTYLQQMVKRWWDADKETLHISPEIGLNRQQSGTPDQIPFLTQENNKAKLEPISRPCIIFLDRTLHCHRTTGHWFSVRGERLILITIYYRFKTVLHVHIKPGSVHISFIKYSQITAIYRNKRIHFNEIHDNVVIQSNKLIDCFLETTITPLDLVTLFFILDFLKETY